MRQLFNVTKNNSDTGMEKALSPVSVSQLRIMLLFAFAIMVVVIIVASLSTYLMQSNQNTANILNTPLNIDQAYWSVTKIEPNTDGDKVGYTLTLTSSIGNIRRYSNVQSYGLSNDRRRIALSVASNMDIVELATDAHTKVNMPFAYSGDFGDAVSWSIQDKYLALTVMKDQDKNDTHLLIFTANGNLVKDVEGNFTYVDSDNALHTYPAKFSPVSDLIMTRVYTNDDLAIYTTGGSKPLLIDQLPVYIAIYNLQGESRAQFPIRDSDTGNNLVVYGWDMTGNYLRYAIVSGDKPINYADDYLFTKQLINLPE